MPFRQGEVVANKYEISGVIGVGCIGFVVAAKRTDLGDEVALKFLRPEYLSNRDLVARFAREAQAAVRVKSEHVARVFDVGTLADGTPFIVMERLEGRDLCRLLAQVGALSVSTAVDYVLQVCEALAAAHAKGVVHRDVKPENLFLARLIHGGHTMKVLDFGVSKVALTGSSFESSVPLVQTTAAVGSPVYMSPEQIRASREVDGRADVWALGCVLYELLTGAAAFDAPSLMQICAMILEREPVPISAVTADVPPELEAVVGRCLAKDPALRFQTVADLAVALCPFAPDHALVWAQRCCEVQGEARVPADDSAGSDFPPASANGSGGGLAVSIAPSHHTTSIAAETALLRKRSWGRLLVPALAAGALGGWFVIRGSTSVDTPHATATPPTPLVAVEPPNAAPPAPAAVATPTPAAVEPMPAATPITREAPRRSSDRPATERRNGDRRPNERSVGRRPVGKVDPIPEPPSREATVPVRAPEPSEREPDVGF